jgi:protein pelota
MVACSVHHFLSILRANFAHISLGTAAVCLLSEHMTVIRQRIDMSIPRKRAGGISGHDKVSGLSAPSSYQLRFPWLIMILISQAMEKFFAAVYAAILRHLPFQTLRAIVIASPGFTRESVSHLQYGAMLQLTSLVVC